MSIVGGVDDIDHALAEKVLMKVRDNPENFKMSYWVEPGLRSGLSNSSPLEQLFDFEEELSCGTTLCVAGWVEVLTEGKINLEGIDRRAAHKLGLTDNSLFFLTEDKAIRVLEHMVDPSSTNATVIEMIYPGGK